MKASLWAGVCIASAFAGTALAADLPASPPDMPLKAPAVAPFSYAGFYAGVHGGYGWGTLDESDATLIGTPTASLSPTGAFGGVQFGYNKMLSPHWLIGSEIDVSGGDLKASGTSTAAAPVSAKIDMFGSARFRAGYVIDRLLLYGTGGSAWATDSFTQGGLFGRNIPDDHVGWTAGVGAEYAFLGPWSVQLEYLYADLGSWSETLPFGGLSPITTKLKLSTAKLGVNYRFGESGGTAYAALPETPVRTISWTGGYIGAGVGYAMGKYSALSSNSIPVESSSLKPAGAIGNIQLGYNWQFLPSWLVGFETDYSFANLKDSGTSTPSGLATSIKIDKLGTVRGRFGYVMNDFLFYATGGLAYAREQDSIEATFATDYYTIGWAAGGGLAYAIDNNWSVKTEYIYADLGKTHTVVDGVANDTSDKFNIIRVGFDYKFGGR
jgi:outer membrane immunogenic protein